eukprot:TRINITY_DN762_c1_g2_i1.p1 TRINITY_DN762_c1_g2~~TRINITY_DN762_c1_g2_i1.p1  ORF type:complete len:303 (+),score=47.47 TRINITY_DN762_c1_g2_i1:54-962(+)
MADDAASAEQAPMEFTDRTTGVFNFSRLKEGCDPANVFLSYEQEAHTLEVHDARLLPEDADILLPSSKGFAVVPHVSTITDWSDEEVLASTYCDEVFAVLKELTGAEHVFLGTPHVSRRQDTEDQMSKPLYHLHNDYTGNIKEAYLCALREEEPDQSWTMEEQLAVGFVNSLDVPAQMKALGLTAERLAERRVIALNTWRNTGDEPLRSCPLAVADKRTIKSSDGCGGVVGRVGLLRREGQQFYYYPGLRREELLVFIGYDSDAKEHAPCAHSAFDDPNTPADAPPRQSIELRCVLVMPAHS